MRVISGKYRGKRLISPKDDCVRPTTDRIKETVFNILQYNVEGARVLDLFAGSGALGIECLSRGASEVVFVDKSRDSISLIRKNLEGVNGNFKIIANDFLSVLRGEKGKFDLIFIDPPYGSGLGEIAIDAVIGLDILSESGIIIYEHSSNNACVLSDARYTARTKNMGSVSAEFIRRKKIALFAGSYDPITVGHEAVIDEAINRYDEVVAACLVNPDKTYTFTPDERLSLVDAAIASKERVRALYSEKTTAEVAKSVNATTLIRGLRGGRDEEYEQEMARYNLECGYKTEFITPLKHFDVSSTAVREEIKNGDYRNVPEGARELIAGIIKSKKTIG